jgi:hypothetical protein
MAADDLSGQHHVMPSRPPDPHWSRLDATAGVLVPGFRPETALERRLLDDPQLRAGLAWGVARPGHPEGHVGRHAGRMLLCIRATERHRADLRVLALVHDAFKYRVRTDEPWAPDNDHATLARRFAERYIDDERVLAALELHDAPYWVWRHGAEDDAVAEVLARVPDLDLFVRFVELDASSPGKDHAFLRWFRGVVWRLARASLAA